MIKSPAPKTIETIRRAASQMRGVIRRAFQAEVARDYCENSARNTEKYFGWSREAVQKGIDELNSDIQIIDHRRSGRPNYSRKLPNMQSDIRDLVDPHSQTHPTFKTSFRYTRLTAKAVLEALVQEKSYKKENLPALSTMRELLGKMGYRLRRVQKTRPKKISETDAIFANVKAAHVRSETKPEILRISIDTKAKVKLGEFSRGGRLRCFKALKALDHDMDAKGILVPFGILEVKQKQFNVVYDNSLETSDFIVDGMEYWWRYNKQRYPNITMLQIDLDNGPEIESCRTQFIKRMVEWSDKIRLPIELVYYPPYHSKYNPVEHCWGVLENHWSGALLTDFDAVCEWTKTMRWDGVAPNVYFLDREYSRGIKLSKRELRPYLEWFTRFPVIGQWSVLIQPKSVV